MVQTLFLGFNSYGFQVRIEIGDQNEFELQSKTYLFSSYINERQVLDSTFSNHVVLFELSDDLPVGLYSAMVYTNMKDFKGQYQRIGFDMILTREDLEFTIDITPDRTLEKVNCRSGENFGYYQHFNATILRNTRMEVLRTAIAEYPEGDEFHGKMITHLTELTEEHEIAGKGISEPSKYPIAEFYFQCQRQAEQKRIDSVDFASPLLIHSGYIPTLVGQYLQEEDIGLSEISKNQRMFNKFKKLFAKLEANREVYEKTLSDLLVQYEKLGRHELVLHLNENYLLAEVCEDQELADKIKAKNQSLRRILVGEVAPNLDFGYDLLYKDLYSVRSEYTLLFFWESTCPHCQDVINELKGIYNRGRNTEFEIVGISLDTSKADHSRFIAENKIEWFNYSDYLGWESDVLPVYHVTSTPSMFLLDRNKKIVSKPRSVSILNNYFK